MHLPERMPAATHAPEGLGISDFEPCSSRTGKAPHPPKTSGVLRTVCTKNALELIQEDDLGTLSLHCVVLQMESQSALRIYVILTDHTSAQTAASRGLCKARGLSPSEIETHCNRNKSQ